LWSMDVFKQMHVFIAAAQDDAGGHALHLLADRVKQQVCEDCCRGD